MVLSSFKKILGPCLYNYINDCPPAGILAEIKKAAKTKYKYAARRLKKVLFKHLIERKPPFPVLCLLMAWYNVGTT